MKLLNTSTRYGLVSRALHWIIVVGILAQWVLAESEVLPLHQSIGLLILLLAAIRLLWRFANPAPSWPPDMKRGEIWLARTAHVLLYVLLFAIPLSGWALSSAGSEPLRFFDTFDVPRFVVAGEETLEEVHEALFNILVGLAVLHVLGAARHWLASRRALAAKS